MWCTVSFVVVTTSKENSSSCLYLLKMWKLKNKQNNKEVVKYLLLHEEDSWGGSACHLCSCQYGRSKRCVQGFFFLAKQFHLLWTSCGAQRKCRLRPIWFIILNSCGLVFMPNAWTWVLSSEKCRPIPSEWKVFIFSFYEWVWYKDKTKGTTNR